MATKTKANANRDKNLEALLEEDVQVGKEEEEEKMEELKEMEKNDDNDDDSEDLKEDERFFSSEETLLLDYHLSGNHNKSTPTPNGDSTGTGFTKYEINNLIGTPTRYSSKTNQDAGEGS